MLQQLLHIMGAAAEGEHSVRRHAFAIANALVSALASLQDSGHKAQTREILQVAPFPSRCRSMSSDD